MNIFQDWAQKKSIFITNSKWIINVDKELKDLPEDIQKELFKLMISKLSCNNLKIQITNILNVDSIILTTIFKEVFSDKFFNSSQKEIRETLKFLEDEQNKNKKSSNHFSEKPKKNKNDLINELIDEGILNIELSKNELMITILKNPEDNYILKALKKYEKSKYIKSLKFVLDFISELTRDITNKDLKMNTLNLILKQKSEARKIFMEYIECSYDNTKNFQNFQQTLSRIEIEVNEKTYNLFRILKLSFQFSYIFPEFIQAAQSIVKFNKIYNDLKISEFNIPKELSKFTDLLIFPVKSRFFKIFVHEKELKYKNNYYDCFKQANDSLLNFIENFDKLKVDGLEEAFKYIDTSFSVGKEIDLLKKFYPSNFKKESLFINISNHYKEYKEHNLLLNYIIECSNLLEIPDDYFQNYIVSDNNVFNESSIIEFRNLSSNEMSSITKSDLSSLIIFFSQIAESSELVIFASSLEDEEVSFMCECYDESLDNKDISLALIQKFSTIWSFLHILKNNRNGLKKYLAKILELIKTKKKYFNIAENINECKLKLNALDDFNNSLNNTEQEQLRKIKMIYQDSLIKIIQREVLIVEIIPLSLDEQYNSAPISLCDLNDLKDRALLSKNIFKKRKDKNDDDDKTSYFEIYDQYIKFVEKLEDYTIILNELESSLFKDSLKIEYEYTLRQGNYENLIDDYKKYENLLNSEWRIAIKEISEKSYIFNFLSSDMINNVDRFLYHKNKENLAKVLNVLNYIGKEPPTLIEEIKNIPPKDIKQRLFEINNFIINLKDCHNQIEIPLQIKKKSYSSGTILIAETKEFYRGVLSIYTLYQKFIPSADLILFCNFSTEWSELKRFIYRCILNPNNHIYTLVNPEDLRIDKQLKFESKLISLAMNKKLISLAIVTKDSMSKLISSLAYNSLFVKEKIHNLMMLTDDQIISIMGNISQNFVIVTSGYVGLGKSELIESEAKNKGLPLYEVNISATYDNSGLSNKIESIIKQYPAIYKFNLNYLFDQQYFHELIFSITVFNLFHSKKSIIAISKDSFVYLEVANTLKNRLYDSIPYLNFLKRKNIRRFTIEKVIISNKLIYVCNYLSSLEDNSIENKDLNFKQHSNSHIFGNKNRYYELLRKYFLPNCGEFPNFHQLTTFLKILSKLFQNFEKSLYCADMVKFFCSTLNGKSLRKCKKLRSCVVKNLIETSKEFISRCVDNVNKSQNSMIKSVEDQMTEQIDLVDCTIKWENSNHYIMVLLEEDIMNIYRSPDQIPKSLRKFITIQFLLEKYKSLNSNQVDRELRNLKNENGHIENYSKYNSEDLIEKLIKFYKEFSLKTEPGNTENFENRLEKRKNEVKKYGYVLTPDNFLKMNLIFLRCISDLPCIIMGETGCGKTSLLRFFIKIVLRESFSIIYIHSGIKISDIHKFLEKVNTKARKQQNQRVWVLFDEFNTSDCMGEIVSVLCERKFEGIVFNPNLVFIGACNPYRLKLNSNIEENVGIKRIVKKNNKVQVMHMVRPLPQKSLEFIWDFGTLRDNEIRDYVYSMLEKVKVKQINLFTNMICAAHKYFQDTEDCSSVSLRDVNRFILLYEWFLKSIEERKNCAIQEPSQEYTNCYEMIKKINTYSEIFPEILSFMHCYYLRLSSEQKRKEFIGKIVIHLSKSKINLNEDQIQNILKFQEMDLVSRMILPKEVALNKALIENIFAIVPCILNKIPVFICGKPGCSKSLAISIVFSSLRGERSLDEYFKTLPELQIISFQGSDSCTSEGIEEVFKKAEKLLNENKNISPVVLFDEIGLAEISKYNPLKVLHKLLEYENFNVGFIAISNWRLDASKMNRALYLARSDPDEGELILTAKSLFNSYRKNDDFEEYLPIISSIARGYYSMKLDYGKTDYPDFFGLRDFYHTIKYVARNFNTSLTDDMNSIIKTALFRNFDGLKDSISKLVKWYPEVIGSNKLTKKPLELIECNLNEPESRFLMIICTHDVSEYLKSELLSKYLIEYRSLIGSTFEMDINQENLRFKKLSDIIAYMEQGIPIILQNMDTIYSSLYDLFNQNYTILGKTRRYCRIALGAQFNPRCLVHENFKVIVFLDSQELTLLTSDAPFLNRFEKHSLILDDIIQVNLKKISEEICEWVDRIMKIPGKKNLLNVESVFPVFSKEAINLYMLYLGEDMTKMQLLNKCKRFLLQNSSMDIVLLCKLNEIPEKEKNIIIEAWKRLHCKTLATYFDKIIQRNCNYIKRKRVKMISVSYDSGGIEFLKQKFTGMIQLEKCSSFKCEEDFNKNYEQFLKHKDKVLYVLELEYSRESHHLRFITNQIDILDKNFEMKENNPLKNVCIIVRQKRSDEKKIPLCILKGWKYKMFEDLVYESKNLLEEIIYKNLTTIVKEAKIFNFENYYDEIVHRSLETINFKSLLFDFNYFECFKREVFECITEKQKIKSCFKDKIIKFLEQFDLKQKLEWISELYTNEKVINSAISVKDSVNVLIFHKILIEFTKLLVVCEKLSGISSLLYTKFSKNSLISWIEIFSRLNTNHTNVQLKVYSNEINFIYNFRTPYFHREYLKLKDKNLELFNSGVSENKLSILLKKYYFEISLLKQKSSMFYENENFQENFIFDFINITLIEESCKPKYSEYIVYFITGFLSLSKNEMKMTALFDSKAKILSIYNLMSLYDRYSNNLDTIMQNYISNSHFSLSLKLFLEQIIEEVTPLAKIFESVDSMINYSEDLSVIEKSMLIIMMDSKPDNFELFEFWVRLSSLNQKGLILTIANALVDKPHNHLFTFEGASWAVSQFKQYLINNESMYRFYMYFFIKILQKSCENIPYIISQIGQLKIWNYSAEFIDNLIRYANIKEVIENFESNLTPFGKILSEKNPYLLKIVDYVEDLDINSPFCDLMGSIIESFNFNINPRNYEEVLTIYMDYIESFNNCQSQFKLVIAVNRVQFYLKQFSELLAIDNKNLQDSENQIIEIMGVTLKKRNFLTYELYCLKVLKKFTNDVIELNKFCEKTRYQWNIDFKNIKYESDMNLFPMFQDASRNDQYLNLGKKIYLLSRNINALDDEIKKPQDPMHILEFGLAFMNKVYLMHSYQEFNENIFKQWYEQKQLDLKNHFGAVFSLLLKNFIYNYPEDSICYLHKKIKSEELYIAMLINYIALSCISHSTSQDHFSSQFFNHNGEGYEDILQKSREICFIGAEIREIHYHLEYMRENFETMKSTTFNSRISVGGTYVCSNTCDMMYIIGNCGGANQKSECGFCNNEIGGKNHKIVERPGHRNLNDDQAREFLLEKCNKYRNSEPKGFQSFNMIDFEVKIRKLKNTYTFILLNFFTNSVFYILHILKIYTNDQIAAVFNIKCENLKKDIEKKLIQSFNILNTKFESKNLMYWLLGSVNKFREVMNESLRELNDKESRDQFEENFEKKISAQSFEKMSNEYKKCLNIQTNPSTLIKYIEEFSNPNTVAYKNSNFFKFRKNPTWDSIKKEVMLRQSEPRFKILNYYIHNFEDIQNLEWFWPILKFSRDMISECSFEVSRAESKAKTIRELLKEKEILRQPFNEFIKAWKNLKLELRYGCQIVEKIEITSETPICFLLVDTDLNSQGFCLAAALKTLCELQNKICYSLPKNEKKEAKKYSLTALSKEDIFFITQENLETMVQKCSVNLFDNQKDQEIFYDFPLFLSYFEKFIEKSKLIYTDEMESVQYQFELLHKYARIIDEIRSKINQEYLDSNEISTIKKGVDVKRKKYNVDTIDIWNQAYIWLEKVIMHIRHDEINEFNKIEMYSDIHIKYEQNFEVSQIFFSFKLSQFLEIYEMVEFQVFPKRVKFIDQQYKFELDATHNTILEIFYERICSIYSKDIYIECCKVLRRIIIRLLTANIDPMFLIADYFGQESYWSYKYMSISESISELFPREFKLLNAIELHKLMESLVKDYLR